MPEISFCLAFGDFFQTKLLLRDDITLGTPPRDQEESKNLDTCLPGPKH